MQEYSCNQEYPPKHLNPHDKAHLDIWRGRDMAIAQEATKQQKQHLQRQKKRVLSSIHNQVSNTSKAL